MVQVILRAGASQKAGRLPTRSLPGLLLPASDGITRAGFKIVGKMPIQRACGLGEGVGRCSAEPRSSTCHISS